MHGPHSQQGGLASRWLCTFAFRLLHWRGNRGQQEGPCRQRHAQRAWRNSYRPRHPLPSDDGWITWPRDGNQDARLTTLVMKVTPEVNLENGECTPLSRRHRRGSIGGKSAGGDCRPTASSELPPMRKKLVRVVLLVVPAKDVSPRARARRRLEGRGRDWHDRRHPAAAGA